MARKFDVVVIDEAAQAVEPAILVPLVQGVKQVSLDSSIRLAGTPLRSPPPPPCPTFPSPFPASLPCNHLAHTLLVEMK